MGTFVKICGLTSAEDVAAVAELRPDAIGFVFWPGSKRAVKAEDTFAWTRTLPLGIRKIGVFVDEPEKEIRRVTNAARLDAVQLHRDFPPDMLFRLSSHVWKAVHLDRDDRETIDSYHVDAYLVDSYTPESPGGTGKVNDWAKARDFVESTKIPVLLAGGLTADNVQQAIQEVRPWGVDVSSGVESSPGKKDINKVREFIEQCRAL